MIASNALLTATNRALTATNRALTATNRALTATNRAFNRHSPRIHRIQEPEKLNAKIQGMTAYSL